MKKVSSGYRICINASNLHQGGALQVAASFLNEMCGLADYLSKFEVTIFLSSSVADNLGNCFDKLKALFDIRIVNVNGIQAIFPSHRNRFKNFDLIFSLFGPDYLFGLRAKRIVGFGQSWVLYRNNEAYKLLSFFERHKAKLKYFLQEYFFRGADAYIVELEHVRDGMINLKLGTNNNIYVAKNCLSRIYFQDISIDLAPRVLNENFRIGIISRNYKHKNLSIIPLVSQILKSKYNRNITFFVTFTDREFNLESAEFQSEVVNLGVKKVEECLETYRCFDAVFFPSLLESFSVTPLEALATGCALFASDRAFVRDVCGEHAYYFDPLAPYDIALVINDYIENQWGRDTEARIAARQHAISFSTPRERALKYIEVINKVIS